MNKTCLACSTLAILLLAQSAQAQTASNNPVPIKIDSKLIDSKPAFGTTKVAVMNLGYVFGNYERAKAFKKELDAKVKRASEEARRLATNLKTWQAAIQAGDFSDVSKEQYEEKIIVARRKLEDLERTMRVQVGKSQQENLVNLWKDVRDAVRSFSAEHDIDLVMVYGDPSDPAQLDQLPNIHRKMQAADAGGATPFFVNPRAEISEAIVEMLNQRYEKERVTDDEQ